MARVQTIKKAIVQVEEQSPKDIQRADIIPTVGFALVVDGIFKKEFETDAAAQKAAKELLTKYRAAGEWHRAGCWRGSYNDCTRPRANLGRRKGIARSSEMAAPDRRILP